MADRVAACCRRVRSGLLLTAVLTVAAMSVEPCAAQGIYLPSVGAVGRSFGGATTAAPLDAASALTWNPAAISGMDQSEMMFAAEFLYADTHLAGSIPAGAIGPGIPPTTRSGLTRSDSGLATVPTIALVYAPADSPWTAGIGILGAVGGGVNFPGSATNPVLTPQNPPGGGNTPPFTFGFGPQYANIALLTTAPTISRQMNDWLAVGAGVTLDSMSLGFDPAFFAPRNANGTFPAATHSRPFWGGSFRLGALVTLTEDWDVAVAYNSPHWFEGLKWNSADETGVALLVTLPFKLPQIVSIGTAYKGIAKTIVGFDVRYFDYAGSEPFGMSPAEGGLGWSSIWAGALGVQYSFTERVRARMGYTFNENPIPDVATLFNTQVPGITQHALSVGATVGLTEHISANLAYVHTFENSISGPIAQVPGEAVTLDSESDSFILSMNVKFGPTREVGDEEAVTDL